MSPHTLTPPAAASIPPGIPGAAGCRGTALTLTRRLDRLQVSLDGATAVPVRLLRARPVSEPEGMLVLMDDRKRCVAEIASLDDLDESSRAIARDELLRRYCLPVIHAVEWTLVDFGNRYWRVMTDRGRRSFLLRDPQRNVCRPSPDELVLRDVIGNRYRIRSLQALDLRSRQHIDAAT